MAFVAMKMRRDRTLKFIELTGFLSAFDMTDMTGCRIRTEKVPKPLYCATQFGARLHTHLVHHLAPMGFDSAFTDAQHVGNLLIR
jgi:hypothetical protein